MEKAENILIVESECEIIKPIFIKNKYNEEMPLEQKNSEINPKKCEERNLDNTMAGLKKSILIKLDKDNKNDYPILEILNILKTPIDPKHKTRKIPDKINFNLFNNELENNLKYVKDLFRMVQNN